MRKRNNAARGRWLRPAFTFVELMTASTITVLTATAGTTLIYAVANATDETGDTRQTQTAGQAALSRIGSAIREARCIGSVEAEELTLWAADSNNNDQMDLNETAIIRYDSAQKEVLYERPDPVLAAGVTVSYNDFTDINALGVIIEAADKQSVVWAEGVDSLVFTGYPANTDTRLVNVILTIGVGGDVVAFESTASPKAPADYLYIAETRIELSGASLRVRRKYFSIWDGFGSHPNVASLSYGTPTVIGLQAP